MPRLPLGAAKNVASKTSRGAAAAADAATDKRGLLGTAGAVGGGLLGFLGSPLGVTLGAGTTAYFLLDALGAFDLEGPTREERASANRAYSTVLEEAQARTLDNFIVDSETKFLDSLDDDLPTDLIQAVMEAEQQAKISSSPTLLELNSPAGRAPEASLTELAARAGMI